MTAPVMNRRPCGWPEHPEGAHVCEYPDHISADWFSDYQVAKYVPLAEALTHRWDVDAHTAAYSNPEIPRRLATDKALAIGVRMVLFIADVDGPDHVGTDEWFAAEELKLERMLADHPGAFIYRGNGGYRTLYRLPEPVILRTRQDAAAWSATYLAWRKYILDRYDIVLDPSMQDWTRIYRLPYVCRDGVDQNHDAWGDPTNIGVWNPEITVNTEASPETPTGPIDLGDLRSTLKEILKKKQRNARLFSTHKKESKRADAPRQARHAQLLRDLLDGNCLALPSSGVKEDGTGRYDALRDVAGIIAFSTGAPWGDALREIFRPSIGAMALRDHCDEAWITEYLDKTEDAYKRALMKRATLDEDKRHAREAEKKVADDWVASVQARMGVRR